jgi:hypothetical protein
MVCSPPALRNGGLVATPVATQRNAQDQLGSFQRFRSQRLRVIAIRRLLVDSVQRLMAQSDLDAVTADHVRNMLYGPTHRDRLGTVAGIDL